MEMRLLLYSNRLKKAQGLPLNMIILAVIGIIVLVIIIVLVQQKTSGFSKGLKNASESTCMPRNEIKSVGTDCDILFGQFTDLKAGDICCRKPTK